MVPPRIAIPSSYAAMPGVGLVHPSMQPADGDPTEGPEVGVPVGVGVARGIGVDVPTGEATGGETVAVAGWLDTAVGRIATRGTGVGGSVVSAIGSW